MRMHGRFSVPSAAKLQRYKMDGAVSYEQILRYCGDAGRWQVLNFLVVSIAGFPEAIQTFLHIYMAAVPDHWCHLNPCYPHSYEYVKNISIGRIESTSLTGLGRCSRYDFDQYFSKDQQACLHPSRLTNRTIPCSSFDFDRTTFQSTITTEWNLVCGNEFWRTTPQAVYFIGTMCGSLLFGFVADSYGRKKAIIHSTAICAVFGTLTAFALDLSTFLLSRFFVALGTAALFGIPNVLVLENVATKRRGYFGILFHIPYGLGMASTAVFGYFIRHWRYLQLATMVPMVLYLLLVSFVPESPRWLIGQGKVKEAEGILRRIAETNRKELPANFSELLGKLVMKESTMATKSPDRSIVEICTDLFKTPKMRRRTLALAFCWFALTLVYDGGVFNAGNLSADLFLYTLVSGLLEIPSYFVVIPLIKFVGRRPTFAGTFFLCAIAMLMSIFMPPGSVGMTLLAWLGIFCMSGAYSLIYAYGAELMPTCVRSYGMGVADFVGAGGSVAGIYLSGLLTGTVPIIVMTVVALTAGLVALLLPETNDTRLPETIEDVEDS